MDDTLIKFNIHKDKRGSLIALEGNQDIPFKIERVYYIFDINQNTVRGCHAHRRLEQLIFCLSGSCEFTLDDGFNRRTFCLCRPDQGLYIKKYTWREFHHFSKNCVLLILASEHYDETDYIRDYKQFRAEIAARQNQAA